MRGSCQLQTPPTNDMPAARPVLIADRSVTVSRVRTSVDYCIRQYVVAQGASNSIKVTLVLK